MAGNRALWQGKWQKIFCSRQLQNTVVLKFTRQWLVNFANHNWRIVKV
jgi:hypothetical protein